jgi:hypothetical protein
MAIQKLVMAMQEVELALKGIDVHERGAKMAQLECKPKHSTNNENTARTNLGY